MLRCPEPPRFFAIVHARLLRAVLKTYGQTVPSFSACRSPRSLARGLFLLFLPSFLPSFLPPSLEMLSSARALLANVLNVGNDLHWRKTKRERERERESGKSSIINRSWRGAPALPQPRPASCPAIEIADEKTCTSYTRIDFFGKSVRSSTNWRSCSMTDLSVARREKRPTRRNGGGKGRKGYAAYSSRLFSNFVAIFNDIFLGERGERGR